MNPPATPVARTSRAATPLLVGVAPCSALLAALDELTAANPTTRKRLVGPDVNFGRELLIALARRTGGWVGWEATNLRGIAESLAFVPLAEAGMRLAGDVEIQALIGRALDDVVAAKLVDSGFASLSRSLGFRGVLGDALLELRTAGLGPDDVRRAAAPGSPAAQLAPVLAQYERLLERGRLADPATIFRVALDAFDREAAFVLGGIVALAPSLSRRGLAGELLQRLLGAGAVVLDADVPVGVAPPEHLLALSRGPHDGPQSPLAFVNAARVPGASQLEHTLAQVDIFAGATPSEELREVARRVVGEGVRWDEVEIVATDPDAYGIALDALCQRLDLGATMLRGLPLARTRLGRALERWLAWLDDGLPADVLREALEAGELGSPLDGFAPTRLAHELRRLRIGWGRARWEAAVARLERGEPAMLAREGESDEELAQRRESRGRTLEALAALLRALLAGTPAVPERGSDRPVAATCAGLARATLSWLALVPLHGPAEEQAAERLRTRLGQLAEVRDEPATFAVAMATLRDALADLRAWPLVTSDRKPWSAAGGMPHLTDVAHAGATGRRRVFVVGLDADRTGGPVTQDPLLPDSVRRALGLATTAERRDEFAWTLGTSLAALRGRVTLSYATSTTLDGREAGPSPLLLQAWRIAKDDPALSYDDLRAALRPPASPVPLHDDQVPTADLDARDVWLDALADGPLLLDGSAVVEAAFPTLAAGLAAREAAQGTDVGAHHGIVSDAGPLLDPTTRPDREISPSSLETLAKCPLAWFYRYGLSIYPPQDPEYDPESWLDALQRGQLLHEVFEAFTREYQPRQNEIAGDAARERILAITRDVVGGWRDREPPPSESVLAAEAAEIERAALAFLEMERERIGAGDRARWLHFELELGAAKGSGAYPLGDGRALLVRGRVDRVDELPDGTLRVVDYKTGSPKPYARTSKTPPFNGGRQLQPALYAAAVEAVCGKPVARFEYRFPTERGQNEVVGYAAGELETARGIVGSLLEQVRAGEFIPTVDPSDCSYCDYQSICRARRDGWDTESPRAEWAKASAPQLPIYQPMLARRSNGGGE